MATVPEATHYRTLPESRSLHIAFPPPAHGPATGESRILRRRPNPEQGRALEILGHAIEYLIDSDIRCSRFSDAFPSKAAGDATRILMALSRQVFAECAEIVPVRRRIQKSLMNMFGRPPLQFPARPGPQI